MNGMEALVYSNHSREAPASTRADCQRDALAPLLNSGANTAPASVQCHYSAGTDFGCGILETTGNRVFDIMSRTWDEWSYP